MTSSLDTNILLRYIWNDTPEQRDAVSALINDKPQTLYVSDLVVAEVIFNLESSGAKRDYIGTVLNKIFALPNIMVSDVLLAHGFPFYLRHPALSFVDCMTAAYAEVENKEPLWTFDRKLANQHSAAKLLA